MAERHVTLMEEKQVIVKRQQEEVSRLMQTQVGDLPRQVDKEPSMDSQGGSNGHKVPWGQLTSDISGLR